MSKVEQENPLSTKERLKKIGEQKRLITAQQKELREKHNRSKTERVEANKIKAASRKTMHESKSTLRKLGAEVNAAFMSGDIDVINKLAENIADASEELVDAMYGFADADEVLNKL